MKKVEFTNQYFEYSLLVYLVILIVLNLFTLISGHLVALITIAIEFLVALLIIFKHHNTKTVIRIWAIILMFSNGISLATKFIKMFITEETEVYSMLKKALFLGTAIAIYFFNEKYVKVKTEKVN